MPSILAKRQPPMPVVERAPPELLAAIEDSGPILAIEDEPEDALIPADDVVLSRGHYSIPRMACSAYLTDISEFWSVASRLIFGVCRGSTCGAGCIADPLGCANACAAP